MHMRIPRRYMSFSCLTAFVLVFVHSLVPSYLCLTAGVKIGQHKFCTLLQGAYAFWINDKSFYTRFMTVKSLGWIES